MYYTRCLGGCQALVFGNSEDTVLTGLAQARDGVFLLREGITEFGCLTLAVYARGFCHSTHTRNARDHRKQSFDFGVLEGSREGVLVVFHKCIIPDSGGMSRTLLDFSLSESFVDLKASEAHGRKLGVMLDHDRSHEGGASFGDVF